MELKHYQNTLRLLAENGYQNCTFTVVPNMNQGGTFTHVSEKQIISVVPFFVGKGFERDWIDMLKAGKDEA